MNKYTGKGIRIGIVDTGIVDASQFNIIAGHNFTLDGTSKNNISSNLYHGTMVATLITNIAPEVELVVAKILNERGIGNSQKATAGIRYCISKNCDIINCSIAGGEDKELEKVIEEAYKKNIIVVAATGNDGKNKILYPAGYYHCISVGSINQSYKLSSFSNYNCLMNLVAIGEDVTVCGITDSGTSFSVPIVTGRLAALKEQYMIENKRTPSWGELYELLIKNCILINGLAREKQGHGYIK